MPFSSRFSYLAFRLPRRISIRLAGRGAAAGDTLLTPLNLFEAEFVFVKGASLHLNMT